MAEKTKKEMVDSEVDVLVKKAQGALEEFMDFKQEQIDEIIKAMAMAGLDQHMRLAKMAVEETGRGIYEDKITKNMFATEYIYHSIKYDKTVGVINQNEFEGYEEVAEPVGVVAGVTPVTNPTSTAMFKSIICMKTRNPIIFAFHPSAQKCSAEAARIVRDAAVKAGAPKDCIPVSYTHLDVYKRQPHTEDGIMSVFVLLPLLFLLRHHSLPAASAARTAYSYVDGYLNGS